MRALRDSPCHPSDGQRNSTMWMGAWNRPMPQILCASTASLQSPGASVFWFPPLTSANRRTFSLTRS